MKIFRWLLSNVFLVMLVVMVIYGYMFWGNLAGDDTPAGKALAYLSDEFVEVEEFIAAVKAKQAKLSAEQAGNEKTGKKTVAEATVADSDISTANAIESDTVGDDTARVDTARVDTAGADTGSSENQQQKMAEMPVQNTAQPLPNRQGQTAANESSLSSFSASPSPAAGGVSDEASRDTFITADVEQQLNNVDEHGKVVNPALERDAVRDNWITARKSFFQRKYDLSEKSYQNVIDSTTDNHDAYGELGNVYFNQGKKQQAASAYFEAASILVRKGQVGRARSLMGLLRQLDSTKASELQTLIDSTIS